MRRCYQFGFTKSGARGEPMAWANVKRILAPYRRIDVQSSDIDINGCVCWNVVLFLGSNYELIALGDTTDLRNDGIDAKGFVLSALRRGHGSMHWYGKVYSP